MFARFRIAPVHLLRPQAMIRRPLSGFSKVTNRPGVGSMISKLRTSALPKFRFWRPNSTKAGINAGKGSGSGGKAEKGIKALVKEYGYSAVGVYLFISMLDLPVCYLLVHSLGKEQIEVYENNVKQWFGFGKSDEELRSMQEINKIEESVQETLGADSDSGSPFGWFSWTEFVIAYGIHKSVFIFVRVPLTAALTPAIVKTLRGWGFKIGSDKLSKSAALAKDTIANVASASNPKFGTRPTKKNKWFWFF